MQSTIIDAIIAKLGETPTSTALMSLCAELEPRLIDLDGKLSRVKGAAANAVLGSLIRTEEELAAAKRLLSEAEARERAAFEALANEPEVTEEDILEELAAGFEGFNFDFDLPTPSVAGLLLGDGDVADAFEELEGALHAVDTLCRERRYDLNDAILARIEAEAAVAEAMSSPPSKAKGRALRDKRAAKVARAIELAQAGLREAQDKVSEAERAWRFVVLHRAEVDGQLQALIEGGALEIFEERERLYQRRDKALRRAVVVTAIRRRQDAQAFAAEARRSRIAALRWQLGLTVKEARSSRVLASKLEFEHWFERQSDKARKLAERQRIAEQRSVTAIARRDQLLKELDSLGADLVEFQKEELEFEHWLYQHRQDLDRIIGQAAAETELKLRSNARKHTRAGKRRHFKANRRDKGTAIVEGRGLTFVA